MKMMDISMQDDCNIEAVSSDKKKKMKQARLPFQMLSSVDSPNSVSNKKRKLTSPLVECKSPKLVKITTKENSIEEETKVNTDINNTLNESNGDIEAIEDVASDGAQGDSTFNESENVRDRKSTPRRNSAGKIRKFGNKTTMKPSALAKFLQKTDKDVEVKEDCKDSPAIEKGMAETSDSSPSTKSGKTTPSVIDNSSEKVEEITPSVANDSLLYANSDSDIAILSSDNDETDEQKSSNESAEKSMKTASPMTPKTLKGEKSDAVKQRKLTPKQQEKQLKSAKRKEERERLRIEKEKKLEEERENRRKEKEERRKEKEEKEKAEREQKMKEKKQKELKKQMEIEQKQKEKEAKEEERRKREEAKEEEKRKKEEEKLEAKRKKQKAASTFASFFVAKKQEAKSAEEESVVEVKNFMPFEVKADMKVAPVCRRVLSEQEKSLIDEKCNVGNAEKSDLYIREVKSKKTMPRKSGKTWPLAKDDVILLEEENDGSSNIVERAVVVEKHKPKLLQFTENRRPPYWGTWSKQSGSINSRKPFSMDTKWFNYEIDSDDEWEEEEPGESLRGSDDEKDEENPDDNEYDVDNEFMVPHGYLSDEEAHADDEDQEDMSPETQKFKLKVLGEQFETERNTKTSKLKPKMIGCVWQEAENKFSENVPPRTMEFFSARQAWVRQIPVALPAKSESDSNSMTGECGTPTQQQAPSSSKKTQVPQEALPDLIRLIHGNSHSRSFLVKEFMTYWNKRNKLGENQISKVSLLQKIREIGRWLACPEEGPMHLKACWYVAEDVRKAQLPENEELTLPNRWSYMLTPKRKSDVLDVAEKSEKEDKERKNVPLITQFTKKITQEEMKKQLNVKPVVNSSPKPAQQRAPRRATLISVARGEQFSETSRENLHKNFGTNDTTTGNSSVKQHDDTSGDVIIIKSSDEESKGGQTAEENKTNESSAKNERLETNPSGENGGPKNESVGSPSVKKLKLGGKVRSKVSKNKAASNNKRKKSQATRMNVGKPGSKE